jgi:hypothetical protein
MKVNLKTCLAVLLGIAIGVVAMSVIRPRPVAAQGPTVFVDFSSVQGPQTVKIRGSRIVGFACAQAGCYVASQ